jgi:hypothetical protein
MVGGCPIPDSRILLSPFLPLHCSLPVCTFSSSCSLILTSYNGGISYHYRTQRRPWNNNPILEICHDIRSYKRTEAILQRSTDRMCRPPSLSSRSTGTPCAILKKSNWSLPRLPPLFAIALIPLLPTGCYLNRGFTIWFHWVAVLYLVSRWAFLERFQVIIGISISLGWYSALIYAAINYGQFCLILYQNMPPSIKAHIFREGTDEIQYESTTALLMMALSHVLDLLGHPLLTYYFWRRHKQKGGTAADIFTSWPAIISSYIYSRLWSMTHLLHNFGRPGMFYIGSDIYFMQHMDCWIPAYAAESLFYALVVAYKLFGASLLQSLQTSKVTHVKSSRQSKDNAPPTLLYSESGVSRSSSMESFAVAGKRESSQSLGTDWSGM